MEENGQGEEYHAGKNDMEVDRLGERIKKRKKGANPHSRIGTGQTCYGVGRLRCAGTSA